jgi:hypothetical protein
MSGPPVDPRAVAALAEAIDAALDTWDAASLPPWAGTDPDREALAEAVVTILSQYGYSLSQLAPARPEDPGYGLEAPVGERSATRATRNGA